MLDFVQLKSCIKIEVYLKYFEAMLVSIIMCYYLILCLTIIVYKIELIVFVLTRQLYATLWASC